MSFYNHVAAQRKTLFVSAGHSNTDPGAAANGYTEADIVTEFRDLVADQLRDLVTFNTDGHMGENLPLRQAAAMAASHDVAVEFHCNAATPAATGCETLSRANAYPLAQRLLDGISGVLGINDRGTKPENSGQHSRLAFVSDGGGIIIELFFITNTADLASYHANKAELAAVVADTLVDEVTQ